MKLEFKGTKAEWINGWGDGLTGPTTPVTDQFCCEEREYIPISFEDQTIAIVVQPKNNSIEEMEANAKLIASAPDLLEALQEILILHNEDMEGSPLTANEWYEAVKKGEKAIEKALK